MSAVLQAQEPSARYLAAEQLALVRQFELLATAPGGAARLRELILALAVQGKLVAQDPLHEPASVLHHRLAPEVCRSASKGRGRLAKPLVEIGEREQWFALPIGWEWARLGWLGDWGAGATPSRSNIGYYGGTIPWFKSGELTADFISESEEKITDRALADCSLRLNQVGDVLVAMYGATIGKTAILLVEGATNQAVCACTPFAGLRNSYLLVLLKALKPYFVGIGAGGAQPNISREKIVATVVGLPPLEEQARIVARVDELMRLCDALEAKGRLESEQHARLLGTLVGTLTDGSTPEELAANWQRVADHFDLLLDRPEAVDALEQAILQLAVRGLLVPQDPRDEPAPVTLAETDARAAQLISEGSLKAGKLATAFSADEVLFDVPESWAWARIDRLAIVQGGIQKTPLRQPLRHHVPYLRVANVQRDAFELDEIERFEVTAEELERWNLRSGDLLIVEGNGSEHEIGRCAIWAGAINPCVYQNHLIRVRCFRPDLVGFIQLFLNSPDGKAEMKRLAITTSGLFNLSVGKIRNYAVPVPPIAEQARIVTRVTELRRLCADLRQRLAASQTIQSHLAEALLDSATA